MRQSRTLYWAGAGELLALGLLLNACATTAPAPAAAAPAATPAASTDGAAAAPAEEDHAAEELRDHHRHHHGGATAFIALSIDSLGVAPEKKPQIEKIQADLEAKLEPVRAAGHGVLAAIADGVAAGTIDTAKVDAALAQLSTAAAGVHAASEAALNQLHDALSPEERSALVEKVQSHWAVWQKTNQDEKLASHEKGTHLGKLAKELDLTPDQVSKIEAGLSTAAAPDASETAAAQAHIDAFSKAFVADKFDAASLTTANAANAHIAKFGAARTAKFYEVVTPILTAEQRTKLAEHLQHHLQPTAAN